MFSTLYTAVPGVSGMVCLAKGPHAEVIKMTHTIAKPTSFGAYPTVVLSPDKGPLMVLELDLTFNGRRHALCEVNFPVRSVFNLFPQTVLHKRRRRTKYMGYMVTK